MPDRSTSETERHRLWVEKNREHLRAYEAKRRADPEIAERLREQARLRRLADPERYRARTRAWNAAHREVVRRRVAEYRATHRDEARVASKAWHEANLDRAKASARAWLAAHRDQVKETHDRRRARQRSAYVAPVNRRAIYERDGGKCGICHKPVAFKDMHLDHIIPLARGGTHEPRNVQVAHKTCNLRKHASGPGQLRLLE